MHKQRIWLAATASVGIHIGLLAWFTQAQATPKATLPSVIPIAVAFAAAGQQQCRRHGTAQKSFLSLCHKRYAPFHLFGSSIARHSANHARLL